MNRMALLSLQMAMGSSSQAAAGTLAKIAEQPEAGRPADRARLVDLAERARAQHESTKVDRLLGLVDEYRDKMVIFTQFRATQELLERRLKEAGHDVAVFHGGLSRLEKEAAIERFRGRPGSCSAPRPAARAATSSSPTPSATSTCPGTR